MNILRHIVVLSVLAAACAQAEKKPAPNPWEFPEHFDSISDATKWADRQVTGGRVDEVALMTGRYLVVFQHGSGLPVVGLAVYRKAAKQWTLVSTHRPPEDAREFLRASAADDQITLTGENSGRRWPLPPAD